MFNQFLQSIFDLFLQLIILLKWPLAIILFCLGLFVSWILFDYYIFCQPSIYDEIEKQSFQIENSIHNQLNASLLQNPRPQDGGPGFLLPTIKNKFFGNYKSKYACQDNWDLSYTVGFVITILTAVFFFIFSYATVRLPFYSLLVKKLVVFNCLILLVAVQITPWFMRASAPPWQLMLIYHILTAGILIWLFSILKTGFTNSKILKTIENLKCYK